MGSYINDVTDVWAIFDSPFPHFHACLVFKFIYCCHPCPLWTWRHLRPMTKKNALNQSWVENGCGNVYLLTKERLRQVKIDILVIFSKTSAKAKTKLYDDWSRKLDCFVKQTLFDKHNKTDTKFHDSGKFFKLIFSDKKWENITNCGELSIHLWDCLRPVLLKNLKTFPITLTSVKIIYF